MLQIQKLRQTSQTLLATPVAGWEEVPRLGHTTQDELDLVWSRKLSKVGPGQYPGGSLHGNIGCCRLLLSHRACPFTFWPALESSPQNLREGWGLPGLLARAQVFWTGQGRAQVSSILVLPSCSLLDAWELCCAENCKLCAVSHWTISCFFSTLFFPIME